MAWLHYLQWTLLQIFHWNCANLTAPLHLESYWVINEIIHSQKCSKTQIVRTMTKCLLTKKVLLSYKKDKKAFNKLIIGCVPAPIFILPPKTDSYLVRNEQHALFHSNTIGLQLLIHKWHVPVWVLFRLEMPTHSRTTRPNLFISFTNEMS